MRLLFKVICLVLLGIGLLEGTAWALSVIVAPSCGLDCGPLPGSNVVTVSGGLIVQPGYTNGTLNIELRDTGPNDTSITSVILTNQGLDSNTTISGVGDLMLTYQGSDLSQGNPLPFGGIAGGSMKVDNVMAGGKYRIGVTINFQSGSGQSEILDITAES
jgi:hypothetical protein